MSPKRNNRKPPRPAETLEGRENQLISLAIDLAERQLLEGSASAQVISHFLKLGSTREALEQERLKRENHLLSAKVEQLASNQRVEALFEAALKAMRNYSGNAEELDDED